MFTRQYAHLKTWVNYVKDLRKDGIVVRAYGDWCPPGGNLNMECAPELSATALYYGALRIMENFAGQLGNTEDAAGFAQLAAETKAAFNRQFYDAQAGGYGSQTADAVALRFEIFPAGEQSRVAKSLVSEIVDNTAAMRLRAFTARNHSTRNSAYAVMKEFLSTR